LTASDFEEKKDILIIDSMMQALNGVSFGGGLAPKSTSIIRIINHTNKQKQPSQTLQKQASYDMIIASDVSNLTIKYLSLLLV